MARVAVLGEVESNGNGHHAGQATATMFSDGPTPKRIKPHGGWVRSERTAYQPDKDFGVESFQTPTDEYIQRFRARRALVDDKGVRTGVPAVEAVFLVPVKRSMRWKPVRVSSMAELEQFQESAPGKLKRTLESGDSFAYDDMSIAGQGNATRLIDREYVPLMAGPYNKQLYIHDYLKMHARSFEMVNHNALAASAIKILTRFVVGRGLGFLIKNSAAQSVWDEFWEREGMRKKIRDIVRDLSWQGEILLRYSEPKRGVTALRNLDASTCWEVVTDPDDVDKVYYYHFQYPAPYQMWVTGRIPISKYIVQQLPPTNVQHVRLNVSSTEKRGRSDLLPAMPWLKRFNDFYDGQTVKAMLEANLTFKVKVKGDQADVDAMLADPSLTELPPPGGMWIENEAVELEPISASLTASRGSGGIGQQIASIVAASLNLPAEYFNIESGGPARATALVRTDPSVKAIEDRQQIIRETLEDMYDRVMASAYAARRISAQAAREDPEYRDDEEQPPTTAVSTRIPRRAVQ